jgi:23S rRNA (adenine1618-N6)-methyltransferase
MTIKQSLHPKNVHNQGYDFKALSRVEPTLSHFIKPNKFNSLSIDFSDPEAVKLLNTALLKYHYDISHWDIPSKNLCPAIPGRADYIHYLADLLKQTYGVEHIKSDKIHVLDIGTGASCIYPILGQRIYQWRFTASDIDAESIANTNRIIANNSTLDSTITCRLQNDNNHVFINIIKTSDRFALTLCNPPFHQSLADAQSGTQRKWQNLGKKVKNSELNFSGQNAELWCPGGEVSFIRNMIKESKQFRTQVLWFTCLVSKKDNLSLVKLALKKANVRSIKVVKMAQGQKISRFVAWSFLNDTEQKSWCQQHL